MEINAAASLAQRNNYKVKAVLNQLHLSKRTVEFVYASVGLLQAELMFRTKCAFQFVCCSFEVLSTPIWAAEHITFCISRINAAVRLFTWSQTWWCGSQVFSLSECPSCSDSLCQENAICKVTFFNACSSPSEWSRISSSLSLTWLREEFSLQQFDPLYKE